MENNRLCILNSHHILKHKNNNNYRHFDDDKNRRSNRIKTGASVSKDRHARQLTEIKYSTKSRRGVCTKEEAYMSVLLVIS